jgi:hypothetical protein
MQHEWSRRFILLRQLRDRPVEPRYRFIQTMKLMNEFRRRPCILQTGFSSRRGTDKLTGVLGRLKQRWCRFEHPQGLIDSWCKSLSYNGIIRARSNSTPARPYMARLRVFSLLICLSFSLPVAPVLRHSVAHRLQVLAYRLRKTLHRLDPRGARIDQPSVQPLRRSTAKQASKPHR